jgi:hypothetical protein
VGFVFDEVFYGFYGGVRAVGKVGAGDLEAVEEEAGAFGIEVAVG